MKFDTRLSCDTLYFGVPIDSITFKDAFFEIKKNLSFKIDINTLRSRSRFYSMEAVNEEVGFYMFFSPHAGLANDYATVQLTGKFFRDIEREKDLELLLGIFDCIRLQRIDVALDVLYTEMPVCADEFTNNLGFPVPSYSENWKNVKLPFMTYGRLDESQRFYINQVSCGKSDLVLRVYDKDLDLMEKYDKTYCEYYGIEGDYLRVFRIEYQMRGKSLKEFLENCEILGAGYENLKILNSLVMSCVFYKFEFLNIHDVFDPIYIPTSIKRKSTLDNRIEYHKHRSGFHYFKYCDLVDQKQREVKENNQIKKMVYDDTASKMRDLGMIFDFDVEMALMKEYTELTNSMNSKKEKVPY